MKQILDFLLLNRMIFKRPVKSKLSLIFLMFISGAVMVLKYSVRTSAFNSTNTIILGFALAIFTGVFSVVAFCWPASDFLSSLNPEIEKFHLNIKRIKLAKGFLYAVILTGALEGAVSYLLVNIDDFMLSRILINFVAVLASLWAGGIVSRCSFAVFEKASEKKILVFFALAAWYYIIVNLVIYSVIRLSTMINL